MIFIFFENLVYWYYSYIILSSLFLLLLSPLYYSNSLILIVIHMYTYIFMNITDWVHFVLPIWLANLTGDSSLETTDSPSLRSHQFLIHLGVKSYENSSIQVGMSICVVILGVITLLTVHWLQLPSHI